MNLRFWKTASRGRRSGGGNTRDISRAFFSHALALVNKLPNALLAVWHPLLDLFHGENMPFVMASTSNFNYQHTLPPLDDFTNNLVLDESIRLFAADNPTLATQADKQQEAKHAQQALSSIGKNKTSRSLCVN
jgi:hypothetical protein